MDIHYHYTAELIPFIFVAFVFGVKKITRFGSKYKFLGLFLLIECFNSQSICVRPSFSFDKRMETAVF